MITSKYVKTGETKKYSMFISPAHQRDISNNSIKSIMESMKDLRIQKRVIHMKSYLKEQELIHIHLRRSK